MKPHRFNPLIGTRRSLAVFMAAVSILFVPPPSFGADWPNGAATAVTLSFDLDAQTVWWQDGNDPTRQAAVLSPGAYGPTAALPKILALLARHDVRATFFVPSWVAEHYPEAIHSIVAGGHEIGLHGVRHVPPNQLTPGEELRRLKESIEVLTRLSGSRPVGYRAPAWVLSKFTLKYVSEQGLLYSSNLMDADLPYVHDSPYGLVELPVSWVLDDAPHFWFDEESWDKTIRTAAEVASLWREEFTAIHEQGGYFGLTMHPQFIGRPARIRMLEELVGWIQSHEGVWITTCRELAEHVRRQSGPPNTAAPHDP